MKICISAFVLSLFIFSNCVLIQCHNGQFQRELIDLNTFQINEVAKSGAYGYTSQQPIKVGGAEDDKGVLNERRFLNALRGPKGEAVTYELKGSCCYYKITNGSNSTIGALDRYEVRISERVYLLYFTSFEAEKILIAPKGFSFVSK